jgi:hypothetical protein
MEIFLVALEKKEKKIEILLMGVTSEGDRLTCYKPPFSR